MRDRGRSHAPERLPPVAQEPALRASPGTGRLRLLSLSTPRSDPASEVRRGRSGVPYGGAVMVVTRPPRRRTHACPCSSLQTLKRVMRKGGWNTRGLCCLTSSRYLGGCPDTG